MIAEEFNIEDIGKYFIGIIQIETTSEPSLDYLFTIINKIQEKYKGSVLQFFNPANLIGQNHLFTAFYFVQKAFLQKINISNSKNMELFLYLSTKRQIKKGLEAFGLNENITNLKILSYSILTLENNLDLINNDILANFDNYKEVNSINNHTIEKYNRIKSYFEITENQIKSVLNSFDIEKVEIEPKLENLTYLFKALQDLIYEKMTILSLEKIKIN